MNKFVNLQQLLDCQRPATLPQALRGGRQLSWGQWRRRVGQWRAVLADQSGNTWALYHPDAFEFSAILFALWATGKVACVPGSNQPLVVDGLSRWVDGYIGDFALPSTSHRLASPEENAVGIDEPLTLDRDQLVLEIFTSGSSGEPQAIKKFLYQLSEEVANLERLWGGLAPDTATVGTVSHHHIYGLLFRVLWPLAGGRCFDSDLSDYLEALNIHPAGWGKILLVSSPSHLSRIPEQTDWTGLQNRCRGIFSSGAPLPCDASLAASRLLGHAPIEVYGSSETGGIAYRQQAAEREVSWQAVPGITLALDDATACLKIRSPYLPPMSDTEWHLTSDRVNLAANGQFQLLGRVDRIAKVEGKRVSLTEMEKRLRSHPAVEEARVLVLAAKRTEIAAAVVLNEAGARQLQSQGRRAMNTELGGYLRQQFERPVVPRRWRYPAELPVDNQGKITQQNLADLFGGTRQGRPLLPRLIRVQQEGNTATLHLAIPDDLFYFQGHFPAAAILPGVVQLQWARHYGGELLGFAGDFSHLEAIKFQHVVRPSQQIALDLGYDSATHKLSFRYYSESGPHSSGRIVNKGKG
ncbi:MAG: AMP-binding protein [Cellvibrionaceae bacterium]